MTKSEVLKEHSEEFMQAMREAYIDLMHCAAPTKCEYELYIWEDGEIETLLKPVGSSGFLQAKQEEPRWLDYVCRVRADDVWQYMDAEKPSEWDYDTQEEYEKATAEAEAMEAEAIEELCAQYDPEEAFYWIMKEIIQDEKLDEERW